MARHQPGISISHAEVCDFVADVVVLKYAQGFHGADAAVAAALESAGFPTASLQPAPGEYVLVESRGAIAAPKVLFVGVVPLIDFDYVAIREFTTRALRIVGDELPGIGSVAMTIHGVGYGLDERESFLAQIGGILDAARESGGLPQVTVVDRNDRRVDRLTAILESVPLPLRQARAAGGASLRSGGGAITAGTPNATRPHIFVAMPYRKEMEDVFVFGINQPINDSGYLCERVDKGTYTGDVLERIRTKIETATLVVAEVSGANPNVYLEIGYAWGTKRPTLLLARAGEELGFDISGQRCLYYESIVDLAKKLRADLAALPKPEASA